MRRARASRAAKSEDTRWIWASGSLSSPPMSARATVEEILEELVPRADPGRWPRFDEPLLDFRRWALTFDGHARR